MTIVQSRQITVPVPVVTCEQVRVVFASTCVPHVTVEYKNQTVSTPVQAASQPSSQEEQAWQENVTAEESAYRQNLDQKIREISDAQVSSARAKILAATESAFKDIIIPLITALTGLVSAIVLLYRGYAPSKPE